MAPRHVDHLFSEAYDGRLDVRRRLRFDDHLAACAQCAEAFADYALALDAVRALPQARMPVPVHLPTGEIPRRVGVGRRLSGLMRTRVLVGGGATLAAAAVLVAVVLVGVHNRGQSPGADRALSLQAGAASTADLATVAPTDFANRVTVSVPGQPDVTLVLATQRTTYAPGETVPVYARVVGPPLKNLPSPAAAPLNGQAGASSEANRSAVMPDVHLVGPGIDDRAAFAPAPADLRSTAKAGYTGDAEQLTIVIPAGLPPGQTIQLVATLPALPGQPPATAVLTLTVG